MKKILFILLSIISLSFVSCDKEQTITFTDLPSKAEKFINQYFGDRQIALVKYDKEFASKTYEVIFTNGDNVEFYKDGEWKGIHCPATNVPEEVIPAKILEYTKTNYPEAAVLEIEKDDRGYDVELSNRMELTFDKNGNIADIDF